MWSNDAIKPNSITGGHDIEIRISLILIFSLAIRSERGNCWHSFYACSIGEEFQRKFEATRHVIGEDDQIDNFYQRTPFSTNYYKHLDKITWRTEKIIVCLCFSEVQYRARCTWFIKRKQSVYFWSIALNAIGILHFFSTRFWFNRQRYDQMQHHITKDLNNSTVVVFLGAMRLIKGR